MLITKTKTDFNNELTRLNLSLDDFSKKANIKEEVINLWNDDTNLIPEKVDDQLKDFEYKVKDYDIILRKGNKNIGFQHLILRHYGVGSDGEVKALDILKIGNVIKQDTTIPAKGSKKIAFIQNKNGKIYKVIRE